MSFYISLTGLNAASTQLSVTSNNIANVGTTAFKRSRADFGDIFATSPLQKASTVIGQGVALKSVSQEFSQGNIQFSANSLDMALTGDGFFIVKSVDGKQNIYTRNGGFQLDESNMVVNSAGQKLLAAKVNEGGAEFQTEDDLSPLLISRLTSGKAVATSEVDLSINLPKNTQIIDEPFDPSDAKTYNFSTSMNVYDSSNNKYLAKVYYVKTSEPTAESPFVKWQTHTFLNGDKLNEKLVQAENDVGDSLYVNKYGELLTASEVAARGQTTENIGSPIVYLDSIISNKIDSKPGSVTGDAIADGIFDASTGLHKPADDIDLTIDIAIDYTGDLSGDDDPQIVSVSMSLEKGVGYTASEIAKKLENEINLAFGDGGPGRYGVTVKYDATAKKFSIFSGTTGDESNVQIKSSNATAKSILGLDPLKNEIENGSGLQSKPAVAQGEFIQGLGDRFFLNASNNQFVVTIDSVVANISLDLNKEYTRDGFLSALKEKINALENTKTGRTVSGVDVTDVEGERGSFALKFTTGTQGDSAFIKVSGSSDWGLAGSPSGSGETVKWIDPFSGPRVGYFNNNKEEVSELSSIDHIEEDQFWAPVFLDKGELTFDTDGLLFSPSGKIGYGGGPVSFTVDYAGTTNYNAPLAVLSQIQNGKPEGDLIGVTVGNDGLVTANYSNGIQEKLGKIILANFTAPTGLRQLGDSSFVATAEAGTLTLGEPGEAGFASVRAGATERSNVDLTQELIELITAQRNFQANAKAIETANTMTQAIVNIRS
jgi:flagellar hook-basal body protein